MMSMFNIFLVLFGIVLKIIFSLFILLKLIVKNKFNYKEEWLNTYFNNKIRVKGANNIPQDNGYIIISNHVSFEDAFFINKIFKNTKFIVANGVIAKLFYKNHNDCIYYDIDPKNKIISGIEVKNKILECTRNNINIGIFPEGEFCNIDSLLPFKKGLFYLAYENNITIVPTLILLKKRTKFIFNYNINLNKKIVVKIFKSVKPSKFKNFNDYYSYIYSLMNDNYKKYVKKNNYDLII
jgi:1-acyl-sn-glycerol-3-phosphate acyltransferase